eukprot:scaffold558_cov120-Isochrysis_galbana.AAC.10
MNIYDMYIIVRHALHMACTTFAVAVQGGRGTRHRQGGDALEGQNTVTGVTLGQPAQVEFSGTPPTPWHYAPHCSRVSA